MELYNIILMAGSQGQQGGGGIQLVFILAMVLVFWLFMIRPNAKKAKNQKKFIQSLEKGSKVVTLSGIHGTISKVNDDNTLALEISPGTKIKIERSAVSLELSKVYAQAPTATQK